MAKKKDVPSFDDLMDDNYVYHYSRADRIAKRMLKQKPEEKKGKFVMLFGGNKMTAIMFVFFVLISVLMWVVYYGYGLANSLAKRRVYDFKNGKNAEVKYISSEQRHGLNVSLENRGSTLWSAKGFIFEIPGFKYETNYSLTLKPSDFDAMFIPIPSTITNIKDLKMDLK